MTAGSRIGQSHSLDARRENPIGRDPDGSITLADPLCSRVHATIFHRDGAWHIRDAESRNGTFVNGQKIDEAVLADGHVVRVGSTEFSFRWSDEPDLGQGDGDLQMTQTIVKEAPIGVRSPDEATFPTPDSLEDLEEILLLYQLSIKLLRCEDPDEIVHVALDLLHGRTQAAFVGYLFVSDDGQLKPKIVLPKDARRRVTLSQLLTDRVARQGRAVWVADQAVAARDSELSHYADAVCAPLVARVGPRSGKTLGAIHVYLRQGRFRQSDFELIVSVANIVSVALVRARSHLSLKSDYERLADASPGQDELVGDSPPMRDLKSKLVRVARAAYCWPGNVRQLRNVIDSAVVLADAERIEADDLGLSATSSTESSLRIDDWERKLIAQALSRGGGSVPDAARLLGIGRATLYRKIRQYGIPRPHGPRSGAGAAP